MLRKLLWAVLLISLYACQQKQNNYKEVLHNPELYSKITGALTDVITFDIFTPPVASRIYAYAHLAAYEVVSNGNSGYQSLEGQLKDFKNIPKPAPGKSIDYPYASLLAFLQVGQALTFSKDQTDSLILSVKNLAKEHGMPEDMKDLSESYAQEVANAVLAWSKKDQYAETRSARKYTVTEAEGSWVPTPPGYFQAVEAEWRRIRPIALDSCNQCTPPPPVKFDKKAGSEFYAWYKQVLDTTSQLTEEQKAVADFWDCNGFKLNISGHTTFATKAMTPGGHWMGIVGIVCKNEKADFAKTVYTYTASSFALMDGFIACWDAKFKWNVLRPETAINKYMDPNWKPYLQTPPFPEYTSGHSVISSAVATVLEDTYGQNITFRDTTERAWGWPDRNFTSVRQAADEAGMSRFYGGIHYLKSIEVGKEQGNKIGQIVLTKLQMKKPELASK